MTRNLKVLGLALLAVCALGTVATNGALAHEFHFDGPAVLTGENTTPAEKFQIGTLGTVSCTVADFRSTQASSPADTITVTPSYAGCSFNGAAAEVRVNHCAFVFDSDTTPGNPDEFPNGLGGFTKEEHANVDIECAEGNKIEIHTLACTVTIGPQTVKHAVRYENEWIFGDSFIANTTGKNIVVGRARTTAGQPLSGCFFFPTGAVGTYTGSATMECFEDEEWSPLEGTAKTTPSGLTDEGWLTECWVG